MRSATGSHCAARYHFLATTGGSLIISLLTGSLLTVHITALAHSSLLALTVTAHINNNARLNC
jgi:hypothetical protein